MPIQRIHIVHRMTLDFYLIIYSCEMLTAHIFDITTSCSENVSRTEKYK